MRLRTWTRRLVTLLLVVAVLNAGISALLRNRRVHRYLTERLAESFGRTLEVQQLNFNFLDGLRLSANRITVGEDPRFGQEYFLRAERLTAGLRWRRFFAGHFEFGTLSFSKPSLNLVRAPDGLWNVESWLPVAKPFSSEASSSSMTMQPRARLYKIEIEGGRINFKSGVDKRPFALVDVSGTVEQESAGRWRLDLAAHPMRAGVTLQQSGTLRVAGRIAGTSTRLQPAELYARWTDASIADMLRLANGKDYGVRGRLTLELNAVSQPGSAPGWSFSLAAQASNIHRWDLAGRSNDPGVSIKAAASWDPRAPQLKVVAVSAEGPHSQLHGSGGVVWQSTIEPQFQFQTQGVDFADIFEWYRAFQAGVAEQAAVSGYLKGQFALTGWPPQLETAEFSSNGIMLGAAALRSPISSGEVVAKFQDGQLDVDPFFIHLPAATTRQADKALVKETVTRNRETVGKVDVNDPVPGHVAGSLKLSARIAPKGKQTTVLLEGNTERAEDLLAVMKVLGHPVNPNWSLSGPVNLSLDVLRSHGTSEILGWIEFQDSKLKVDGLNLPLEVSDGRLEWRAGQRSATLRSVRGLGAQWTGTLTQRVASPDGPWQPWQCDLSADNISAVDMDRWLGPRARRGFLERLLPGLATNATQSANATAGNHPVKNIHALGRIAIAELQIAPMRVRRLTGSVKIDGRTVRLEDAKGEFYSGNLSGSFEANLQADPEYRADAEVERVNLSALAAATTTLRDRFAGFASARIHLTARGIGREELLKTMEGSGEFSGSGAQIRGLDLKTAVAGRTSRASMTQWPLADGTFAIDAGGIRIIKLRLKDGTTDVFAEGKIDYSHALDLQVRPSPDFVTSELGIVPVRAVHLTGTLEAPQVEKAAASIEAKPARN